MSESISNAWVTIEKMSIANKLLDEPTTTKWMLFKKKKKRFKTTVYFRTFFTLSCFSIGSITRPVVVFVALFREFVTLHPYSCYRLLEE